MDGIPSEIGKYSVECLIGEGGMGRVFKAIDPRLGRNVAIKMIRRGGDQEFETRFAKELKTTAKLDHESIVKVYDSGVHDGDPYLVMEFIDGASLEAIIRQGTDKITLLQKLGIVINVCNGLHHAHERSVIHRDIKPANVMVRREDGLAKIVDFGIARQGGKTDTATGMVAGTVEYMSPEQLLGKDKIDRRTDIFSVGVVLYRLLSGTLPFRGDTAPQVWRKIIDEPPAPLDLNELNVPGELNTVLMCALAKTRDQRYETAREMALDLGEVQGKVKAEHARHYLNLAEEAEGKREWQRAFEHLQQVVRVVPQNTTARQQMSRVREQLELQRRTEQSLSYKAEAEAAYRERDFERTLQAIEQGEQVDDSSPFWANLRDQVNAARELSAKLERLLGEGERKLKDRDLTEADRIIKEVLKLAPANDRALRIQRFLDALLLEEKRKHKLGELLDQAGQQIRSGLLDEAERTLDAALDVDSKSIEIAAVSAQVKRARQEAAWAKELEALHHQIDRDIEAGNFHDAGERAADGLRRFPSERSLKEVMRLIEDLDVGSATERAAEEERERARAANDAASEGRGVLDREGTESATKYLQRLPKPIADAPELSELVSVLEKRRAAEQPEAEEVAQARSLESHGQIAEALEAWRQLQASRPDVPDYGREVKRLQQQVDPPKSGNATGGATVIIEAGTVSDTKIPRATLVEESNLRKPEPEPLRGGHRKPVRQAADNDEISLWRRPAVVYPSVALLVLVGALAMMFRPHKTTTPDVSVTPPSDHPSAPLTSDVTPSPPQQNSPAAVVVVEKGTILIRCKVPMAFVSVGGENQGIIMGGEKTLEVPVGSQQVRITAAGYEPQIYPVAVKKGKTQQLDADLKPSSEPSQPKPKPTLLEITSDPGAMVSIGGQTKRVGQDGKLTFEWQPGRADFTVTKEGFVSQSKTIDVREGVSNSASVNLDPLPVPQIKYFKGGADRIQEGNSVKLFWETSYATKVLIASGTELAESVENSGEKIVSPKTTTTYTLTAIGPGGASPSIAPVTVKVDTATAAKVVPEQPRISTQPQSESDFVKKWIENDFAKAYGDANTDEIRALWPSLTDKKAKELLGGSDKIRRIKLSCASLAFEGNTAHSTCQAQYKGSKKGKEYDAFPSNSLAFTLKKLGAGWVVVDIAPR